MFFYEVNEFCVVNLSNITFISFTDHDATLVFVNGHRIYATIEEGQELLRALRSLGEEIVVEEGAPEGAIERT